MVTLKSFFLSHKLCLYAMERDINMEMAYTSYECYKGVVFRGENIESQNNDVIFYDGAIANGESTCDMWPER